MNAKEQVTLAKVAKDVRSLADGAFGKPRPEIEGGGRYSDGWVHRIGNLEEGQRKIRDHLSNGGVKVRPSRKTWLTAATAVALIDFGSRMAAQWIGGA